MKTSQLHRRCFALVDTLLLRNFLGGEGAEGILAGNHAQAPAVIEITVDRDDIIYGHDCSFAVRLPRPPVAAHVKQHDARSGRVSVLDHLRPSVQAIPFCHFVTSVACRNLRRFLRQK